MFSVSVLTPSFKVIDGRPTSQHDLSTCDEILKHDALLNI